ncbi:MAG: alpha/beta hydrolase [Proteobacteria bacterium]|nr:alpha/beta hydrolase [Pseudomonadota bacterium]
MTPFFFGPAQRRLFGMYHPPAAGRANGTAVLLCYPFGQEAIRSHRFFRLMAERLSRQGAAVLRFDYHGTGDAPGDDEEGELAGWTGDVREAHRELLRASGAMRITWFGARLGATLALAAAAQATPPVQRLVLWDPVFDGPAYLEALRHAHVHELETGFCIPDAGWRRALARDATAFTDECLGFAISPRLREQVSALRPAAPEHLPTHRITLIAGPGDDAARQWAQASTSRHAAAQIALRSFAHPLEWTSNAGTNNELVPAEALQTMIGEIHGQP